MNTADAVAQVRVSTNRPDKDAEALSAINEAISTCTMRAEFARDLVESDISISSTEYGQTINISTHTTRFRKWKYIRPISQRRLLVPCGADQMLQPNGFIQKDRFFMAGDNLTFVLSSLDNSLLIGYYQYAPLLTLTEGSNSHWMLDLMPFCIINYAKATIFRSVGDDASAKLYEGKYEEQFLIGRRDFKDSVIVSAS